MQQDVVSNMRLHKVLTIPRTKEQVLLNRPEKRFSVMTTEIDAAARHFYDRMMRHISEHTQSNIAADLIIQQQYVDTAAPVDKFLSSAQTILSSESEGFNSRIGGHYWADDSRDLIAVIQALRDFNTAIQPQGWELQTKPGTYLNQLFDYLSFLSESGGSEIPPDIPRMNDFLLAKTAIFSLKEKEVDNQLFPDLVDIRQLGKGSYAKVWSGVDEKTGVRIAFKRANDGLSDEDMTRFRHEFDIMHRLDSPYIVKAYSYDPVRHQYTMEYVPQTLSDFMRKNNNKLSPRRRKDLALQFLRGMRYIHSSSLLHRDLSYTNVLIHAYTDGSASLKISDFGLTKDLNLSLTRTSESRKGSLLDPFLDSYGDYATVNEMYSVGMILNMIFHGSKSLQSKSEVDTIISHATSSRVDQRYTNVKDIGLAIDNIPLSDIIA